MLVGRQNEQRVLDELVANARLGRSAVLLLAGEAGIGKTALLQYAAEAAAGMVVLRVTGAEAEQNLPFAALAQLLRPSSVELDDLPAPQAEALGVALALRAGHHVDRFAVGAAVLTLLTRRSENQPLALLIDDAHLVDLPSQEALGFVARRLLADAMLIVVAVRSGEPCALASAGLPALELGGIDLAATRELVSRQESSGSAPLAQRVHELSGGNPLAVMEMAGEPSRVLTLWPGGPGPVPAALVQLYARRAAQLNAREREALLLAATAGSDLALVARACAASGIDVSALAGAERVGLVVVEQDRIRFSHPLARSATYSTASPAEQRRLHALVASVTSDAELDRRAWHRSEAAFGPDEPAAENLVCTARRAAARGAFSVAATALERAARLSREDDVRARRLVGAGDAAWSAGESSRADALLEESLRLTSSAMLNARAQRLRGIIALRSGSVREARSALLGAARATSRFDSAEALTCWAEAIDACFYLADPRGALAVAEELDAALRAGSKGRTAGVAAIAAGMARVLAGQDGAGLIRHGVSQLAALGPDGSGTSPGPDLDDATWSILGPLFLRDSGTGRDLVRQAVEERRHRAAIGTLPHLLFHLARDQAGSDRWPQAEGDYTEAIALASELGQTTELAASSAGLAWLLARQGREHDTRRHADVAERLGIQHDIQMGRVWSRHALGDLALGLGQIELAVATYSELAALLDELGVKDVDLSPAPELVDGLLRLGRVEEAVRLERRHAEEAATKGLPWALARAARLRLMLGPAQELEEHHARAHELHAATLDRFEAAQTQLAYGSRLRRLARRVDARAPLQDALTTFSQLGARPWADRAADELSATGATARRAGAHPLAELTQREVQIALLLAEGHTIRQAAAALFLSPKTVEYHLRHVYLKLEISSRRELTARMQRGGQYRDWGADL